MSDSVCEIANISCGVLKGLIQQNEQQQRGWRYRSI